MRDEADQARYVVEQVLENREAGTAAEAAGGAVPRLASQRAARDRADPPQHPVREVRRAEVPRRRARQGHARGAALRREPARPRRRLPRAAAAARRRAGDCGAACSTAMAKARRSPSTALADVPPPPRGAADWPAFVALCRQLRGAGAAGRPSSSGRASGTSRISSASTRTPTTRRADLAAARADRRRLSLARALPDRADARSAGRHQRPGRRRRCSTRTI